MKALIVAAHGTGKREVDRDVEDVVELIRGRGVIPVVEFGFLEAASPTILEAMRYCIQRGARQIVVVPYFLSDGVHASIDLGDVLSEAAEVHPEVEIRVGENLGRSTMIEDVIRERVRAVAFC